MHTAMYALHCAMQNTAYHTEFVRSVCVSNFTEVHRCIVIFVYDFHIELHFILETSRYFMNKKAHTQTRLHIHRFIISVKIHAIHMENHTHMHARVLVRNFILNYMLITLVS